MLPAPRPPRRAQGARRHPPALGLRATRARRTLAAVVALAVGTIWPLAGGESVSGLAERPRGPVDQPAALDDSSLSAAAFKPAFPRFLRRVAGAPLEKPGPGPQDGTRELLLTFDDGPNLEITPLVLEELDRRGVKAVFFIAGHTLVGDRAEDRARRDLLRKLARHGHLIANHTVNHGDLCTGPARQAIDAEIDGNAEILTATTGLRPLLFRSPYGARCRALQAALDARGLVNVGWNVDPQEWRSGDAHAIATAVIGQIQRLQGGRGIILLHDTKHATARALPVILDWIDAENKRAAAGQARALRLVDYSVFLPSLPLPRTGVEKALAELHSTLALPLQDLMARGVAPVASGI